MHIYADHAATTQLSPCAREAMQAFLDAQYANPSQLYSFASAARRAVKQAREDIAACLHALPEEIYFTSCGTESDNWAIKGTTIFQNDRRRVLTSAIEHHAVLHSCQSVERLDVPVCYLPVSNTGLLTPETLRDAPWEDSHLVSVMMVNNEIGSIQPIEALCSIAHAHACLFHTDAVQAVGHIPIDLQALPVDLLSASAHKFHGPKGVGFLYIRQGTQIAPLLDGGRQEQGLRAGTENTAGIVGMAAALTESCQQLSARMSHLKTLEKALLDSLSGQGLDYLRNGENQVPGNVSLSFPGVSGETLLHRLDLMGICVSTGSACNSRSTELSHVLRAIHLPEAYAYGTIRISFGYENTVQDAIEIAQALVKILRRG